MHEVRAYITNLRNHLMSEIGASDWIKVLTTVAQVRGYFDALRDLSVFKRLDVNSGAIEKAKKYLDEIEAGAKNRDQRECNTKFLLFNEFIVDNLDIPTIIDQ